MTATLHKLGDVKPNDDYPLAHTKATRMFKAAVDKLDRDSGTSQRNIAKTLGYKSSVVISHMANGRAPIPIERTPEFSRLLKINPAEFLIAVLEQRFPNVDFMRTLVGSKADLAKGMADEDQLVLDDLEAAAGVPLSSMPRDQYRILKEAAADPSANRRWLTPAQMGIMDVVRAERKDLAEEGLTPVQRRNLASAIAAI